MTAKFWVGGTGTWDNSTTTHWSLSSGGAGGAAVPGSADTITFDGSSGGGTVTVDATINGLTFNTITMGAFTGTLDFSVNNPSITLGGAGVTGFSITGTGTRTLKLGSGTFNLKGHGNVAFDATTTTNLTYDTTSTATFNIVQDSNPVRGADFQSGSLSFTNNTLNLSGCSDGEYLYMRGSPTFKSLTISGSGLASLRCVAGATITITNALNIVGTNTLQFMLTSDNWFAANSKANMAIAAGSTCSWGMFASMNFTGNTLTASSSFDLGNNAGVSISQPSGGGGGGGSHMIGG